MKPSARCHMLSGIANDVSFMTMRRDFSVANVAMSRSCSSDGISGLL